MSERFKVQSWKGCVGAIPPWVRIPSPLKKGQAFALTFFYVDEDENTIVLQDILFVRIKWFFEKYQGMLDFGRSVIIVLCVTEKSQTTRFVYEKVQSAQFDLLVSNAVIEPKYLPTLLCTDKMIIWKLWKVVRSLKKFQAMLEFQFLVGNLQFQSR